MAFDDFPVKVEKEVERPGSVPSRFSVDLVGEDE